MPLSPEVVLKPMTDFNEADYKAFLEWKAASEAAKEAAKPKREEVYVHLANGDVHRVFTDDNASGLVDGRTHFIKDGHAHSVIGVYPVENKTTTSPTPED